MLDDAFVQSLIEEFGSPLFVYDLEQVEARATHLLSVLPSGSRLFYSFKANPLPEIGQTLKALGCGAEISSPGELDSAFEAGFSAREILYTGPGKTEAALRKTIHAGVTQFSCESWNDMKRLAESLGGAASPVQALLRVNPDAPSQVRLSMSGVASQFGFEESQLLENGGQLRSMSQDIQIAGVHVYYGSQMEGADAVLGAVRSAISTAERISARLDMNFTVLDVGGGFPWPFAVTGSGPSLASLGPALQQLSARRELTRSAELWFESGRYLVASAGTLLTRVLDVKISKGSKKYVVLDSGINHLGGMSGLGRIMRPRVSLESTSRHRGEETVVDVVGPLCSPLDVLGSGVSMACPSPGDVVQIPNVGAYGLTASLIGFLSHEPPIEVTCRGKRWHRAYQLRHGHEVTSENKKMTA